MATTNKAKAKAKAGGGRTRGHPSILEDLLDESRPSELAASAANGVVAGHLVAVDDEGCVLFEAEASKGEVQRVTIGLALSDGAIVQAVRRKQRALVLCSETAGRPVLIGLLRDHVSEQARDAGRGELEARVDGETLILSAEQQIELRCGKARLLLRRDGRVVLRGAHIVSRSTGPNRIKGASIALN